MYPPILSLRVSAIAPFLGHLVVENNEASPPLTHDLTRLAERAALDLDKEQLDFLDTVTTFNIHARYDAYKNELAARCAKEYAEAMISKIEELQTWIRAGFGNTARLSRDLARSWISD